MVHMIEVELIMNRHIEKIQETLLYDIIFSIYTLYNVILIMQIFYFIVYSYFNIIITCMHFKYYHIAIIFLVSCLNIVINKLNF